MHPLAYLGVLGLIFLAIYILLSLLLIFRAFYLWRKNKEQITWKDFEKLTWWDLILVIVIPLIGFLAYMFCR